MIIVMVLIITITISYGINNYNNINNDINYSSNNMVI